MNKLIQSHVAAKAILEATEHLRPIDKPAEFAGVPWQQAYAGYKAQRAASRALHERDRIRAAVYVAKAERYYQDFKGDV
jgi:hypothetical protein